MILRVLCLVVASCSAQLLINVKNMDTATRSGLDFIIKSSSATRSLRISFTGYRNQKWTGLHYQEFQCNKGGDSVQETISADTKEETVTLEYKRGDGTLVTQLLDYKNEVHIMKVLVLGEVERGQSQYQVMCFIYHLNRDDFIQPDAMAKLRQKNPGTVRTAEEDKGQDNYTMDTAVNVAKADILSPHLASTCSEARDSTYTRELDLLTWASLSGLSLPTMLGIVTRSSGNAARCLDTVGLSSPCTCRLEVPIGWYPCGLKYCKLKEDVVGRYRCGIRTCRRSFLFSYHVTHKRLCLWDE